MNRAIAVICVGGAGASVHGTQLSNWVEALYSIAEKALDAQTPDTAQDEARYLDALREWKRTPPDAPSTPA